MKPESERTAFEHAADIEEQVGVSFNMRSETTENGNLTPDCYASRYAFIMMAIDDEHVRHEEVCANLYAKLKQLRNSCPHPKDSRITLIGAQQVCRDCGNRHLWRDAGQEYD